MPIKIPNGLPAIEILNKENIFVMTETRAIHQDIRPLKIAIYNLMPAKVITETQIIRVLSNSPLQVEVDFLHFKSHISKNTSKEHLSEFYKTFDEIKNQKYDGMIITGAPVEKLDFEQVDYWDELKQVMDWSSKNVFSIFHICWAAQAGLYYFYKIPKYALDKKVFGVFSHSVLKKNTSLLRGFDDEFYAPHSRYTEVKREDIEKIPELEILAESEQAGIYIASSKDGRRVFVTGHSEYDALTLKAEYDRDIAKGLNISVPENYFPEDNPQNQPVVKWRCHANILFSNWLNYCVYQETPYDLNQMN